MTGDGDRDDEVDDGNGSDILMPKLTRETKDTRTRSESPAVSPTAYQAPLTILGPA
jgi:hypothetical protein